MSLIRVSKFSRGSQAKPQAAPPEAPVQNETPVSQEEPKSDLQKRLERMDEEDKREDMSRQGLMDALKQQYLEGRPFDKILEESGVPRATLFRWRKEQKWDEEKNKKLALAQKLAESLAFYEDPTNTEQALAQSNLQLLLKIQGINLAKLAHKALAGEAPDMIAVMMSDSLNKYSGMLEKLIKSDHSIKSGGVERKEVVHIQALDMDDAVRLALEMKKKGQQITVQEAMSLLTAQQANKSEKK